MKKKCLLAALAFLGWLSADAQSVADIATADSLVQFTDTMNLEGVTVVAQRPIVKMAANKVTYDVVADTEAKSQTVLDLLRKVPMVTVDGQDNITVCGSSSFKVYVDGKPSALFSGNPSQVFKSMPASMVRNIEVMTNPGARYDAEGAGGVLNIIMNGKAQKGAQTQANGYNGSIALTAGSRSWGGSAFVSGQQGRFSYSANAVYNYNRSDGTDVTFERSYGSGAQGTALRYWQTSDAHIPFTLGNISLGYDVDSLSSLSASLGLTSYSLKNSGHPVTTWTGAAFGSNGFSYENDMRMTNSSMSLNASLDYQRYLNRAKTGSLTLAYYLTTTPTKNDLTLDYDVPEGTPLALNDQRSQNHARLTEHTFQADLVLPMAEKHRLNVGAKYILRQNASDADYYNMVDGVPVFDENNSVDYENRQNIGAAYAEYDGKMGRFGLKTGLRYEQTWEKTTYASGQGENYSRRYGNLVPSASLSYGLTPSASLGLNYNLRITRPVIAQLNPYVNRSTPNVLSYGNPSLDTERTHHLAAVFNSYSRRLVVSTTLGQTFGTDGIQQYSFLDGATLHTTYGNVAESRLTSLNAFVGWQMAPRTRLMLNGQVAYADLRSDALAVSNHGWQGNVWMGLQQTLPFDIKGSLSLYAKSREYTLQGYSGGMNIITVAASKSLLKDKLDLSASYMTPLTGRMKIHQESCGTDFAQKMLIRVPLQSVSLTVKWNFGNTKRKFREQQQKTDSSLDYLKAIHL